jgi:nucleoside-diphosphate-sugar epimerase
MPEAVLLTGATGFVGRAILAELVARGIPVHAVSRRSPPLQDGVTWHNADLLTPQGRRSVANLAPRLIHCAWEVKHGLFWSSPANRSWHMASVDLTRRFRAAGGQTVLGIGTCAEYDATDPGPLPNPWTEARAIAPATPYGQAKAALHRDLADLCGDALIWARLFHLYGPGEDCRRLIPSLINRLSAGQPAEVRAASLVRDYASTAHVAGCLVALLEADAAGPFDIGSGQARSLGDLGRIIASTLAGPDLLCLSYALQEAAPLSMAPQLSRLQSCVGQVLERPETALARYTRLWVR